MYSAGTEGIGQSLRRIKAWLLQKKMLPAIFILAVAAGAFGLRSAFADTQVSVSVKYYDQCSNDDGDGYATGTDTGCRWTSGNIQSNNSVYYEGDATVQRLLMEDITSGPHSVTFQYDTTKGGKHAYDFLTSDNYSELAPNPLSNADICDSATSSKLPSCSSISPSPDTANSAIPQDANANNFDNFARYFRMRNGVIDSVSAITATGSYISDSSASITVNFHVDPNTCVDKYNAGTNNNPAPACAAVLTFGAHVSKGADWGAGTTAVNISGSPYHVALKSIDSTSIGQRDNQMQASAVVIPNTITIHKVTSPSSDTTTSFGFTTTGTGYTSFSLTGGSQNQQTVVPGNYTVTETNPSPQYALTNLTCTASGTGSSATTSLGTRKVTITIGQAGGGIIDCTYTNTLQQAHLTLVKSVTNNNGGTASATDWTLAASGPTPISGVSGNSAVTNAAVLVGSYTLSESGGPSGYSGSDYSCVKNGGSAVIANSITLAAGDNGTCTVTNNDIAPSLTLVKYVTNDNGGTALATDWTLTATGSLGSPTNLSGSTPVASGSNFKADTYSLAEINGPNGYQAGSWNCVGGSQNGNDITLGLAESATCSITNDDIAPTLTVIKVVDNGTTGATYVPADFQMMVNGGNIAQNTATQFSVGSYAVTESGPSGYTTSFSGDCDSTGNVTLALADAKTCTVTNTAIAPTLKIVKTVINNNGGTAVVSDFTLQIDGSTVTNNVAQTVTVGSHTASEITLSGYTPSDWGTDCNAAGSVTLALAENKVCTITNDDQPATLHVVKVVINDNGGTLQPQDFSFTVNGGSAAAFESDGQNDLTVDAGTYSVVEPTVAGYATTYNNCSNVVIPNGGSATCTVTNNDVQPRLTVTKVVINDNGGTAVVSDFPLFVDATGVTSGVQNGFNVGSYTVSETNQTGYAPSITGDCDSNGSVSLALGDVKACTITNNDIAPTLTLVKTVVNDNGGNAVVSDFPLFVNGNPVTSGVSSILVANTLYTASETSQTGYLPGSWGGDCAANGTITLAPGDAKTCTITNDDIAPTITLNKIVVNNNGGSAGINDFGLTVGGNGVTSGQASSVLANTAIALNEAGLTGYGFVSLTGDSKCPAVLGGTVTLDEGENVTCTITNDDIPATLTVIKHVINNNAGTKAAADFTMSINGVTATGGNSFAGVESPGVTKTLMTIGSYTVSESGPSGYNATLSADCDSTIALGEMKTCTITNDDVVPPITRTQGFWQTHYDFTSSIYNSGDSIWMICPARTISSKAVLFGGFYASIPKTTTGAKRTSLDQARMQLMQQLLAAILNHQAFGTGDLSMISSAKSAYCGTNTAAILSAAQTLDAFNNSGDTLPTNMNTGKASPIASKASANLTTWNILP